MKLYSFINLFFLTGLLGFSACQVLDVEPTTAIEGNGAVSNATEVERAALGVYSGLQSGNYYGLRYLYYQDLYADNLEFRGSFSTDQEVEDRIINPSNLQIANTWASIYSVINRANTLIAQIPNIPDLDADEKNEYIGEMRFLRALAYYDLLKVFGGVPVATEATVAIEDIQNLPRSTEAQVYAQIIQDLSFAENNMLTLAATTRGSSLAATALLARVYLQQGDYTSAAAKAETVINSGEYALQASYPDIFTREKTAESIFELDFTINDQNGLASASDPTTSGQRFYWRPGGSGFYSLFEASGAQGDTRFAASARLQNNRNRIVKYFRLGSNDDNVPVIRLAEMYLIRAEAVARLGASGAVPDAQVLDDLNLIRNRANLPDISPATNADALTAILAERRFELAAEGHRFTDLKRYGLAENLFDEGDEFRVLWPIPLTQIEVNPALLQNPGY